MTMEDIFSETEGFGQFQRLILLGLGWNRLPLGWSMLQMSYLGMEPKWQCLDPNQTRSQNESATGTCSIHTSNRSSDTSQDVQCWKFHYLGSSNTAVTNWDLLCETSWVPPVLTVIQMAGVVLGALMAGLAGDCVGRKKTTYLCVLEHAVMNLLAASSLTWQMFATFRFFIGLGIGGILVTSHPYQLEFLSLQWRPVVSALPFWSVGVCLFALTSYLTESWWLLHIVCGVLSLVGLLGYCYVPESLRWLTVQDRIDEAQTVVLKMAVTNGKLQPRKASITLQTVAWEEQKHHTSKQLYTYLDLFLDFRSAATTLIFCFHWFSTSLVYYSLSLSAASLAGGVHLNIFMLAVVEIPAVVSTLYLVNRFGRKWPSIVFLGVTGASTLICLAILLNGSVTTKSPVLTVLCLVVKFGLGAAIAVGDTWCSESYPTVTRCLGFGAVNVAGGLGALVAPLIVDLEKQMTVPFIIMTVLLITDAILCSFLPETKGTELADTPTHVTLRAAPEGTCDDNKIHDTEAATSEQEMTSHIPDITVINDEFQQNEASTGDNPAFVDNTEHDDNIHPVTEEEGTSESPKVQHVQLDENDTNLDTVVTAIPNPELRLNPSPKVRKSPRSSRGNSPNPSPKRHRLRNSALVPDKLKSKPKEDTPPYIESTPNKNVRFSIY